MTTWLIDASNAELHNSGMMGGFYVRPMYAPAGHVHAGHKHYIDHLGELVYGRCLVEWQDEDGTSGTIDVREPAVIHIKAGRTHRLTFPVASLWRCLFAEAEADRVYGNDAAVPYYFEVSNG